MGFTIAKFLLPLQLSLLCSTVFGEELFTAPGRASGYHLRPAVAPAPSPTQHHHHHRGQPPIHAPAPSPSHQQHHHRHSPSHAPLYPPAQAPVHPPLSPLHPPVRSPGLPVPRTLVAVQGVVYCKSCKYRGIDTLLGASPLVGAIVKLQCNNTKYPLEVKGKSDEHGYFYLQAPEKVTNYAYHKCKVSLVSSPNVTCSKKSNLHGGISGGDLRPEKKFYDSKKIQYVLYSVGPFAFEPKCPH